MATHQDLLDAIARVRATTGDPNGWTAGLSGEDIAVATNPLSPPTAVGAVLTKVIAAHPDSFQSGPPAMPGAPQGAGADAIRAAETALAQQKSAAAQVDLQVVTAVLNADATHAEGVVALNRLQREIEEAVAARADLDTPAGARAFQRYLLDRLSDIRAVVETAGLDSTSKAALVAALAAVYASSTPEPFAAQSDPQPVAADESDGDHEPDRDDVGAGLREASESVGPLDWVGDPLPALEEGLGFPPLPDPAAQPTPPAPAMAAPAMAPAPPGWGGGIPAPPFSGGMAASPPPALPNVSPDPLIDLAGDRRSDPGPASDEVPAETPAQAGPDGPGEQAAADEATLVELPGGETVTAPSPELAAVITAAVAGAPIPDAFREQGITIPEPGTPVIEPVEEQHLVAGDIGLFTDRHALALGNGTALVDQQIQPISSVTGPGFLGWQHPPAPQPQPVPTQPEPPAPIPSAATAPS